MDARIARRAIGVAAVGGLLAELVFDRQPLGIGLPLFVLAVLVAVTRSSPRRRPADRLDWWLPATAVAASIGPALRTDPSVVLLDLVLVVVALAAWSVAVSGVAVTRRSAAAVTALGLVAGAAMMAAPAWLLGRVVGDGALRHALGHLGRVAPVVRGVLIAVPIVAGFAVLLGSADAIFERAIDDAFRFTLDLDDVAGRGAFALVAAAIVSAPVAVAAGIAGSPGFPIGSFDGAGSAARGDAPPADAVPADPSTTKPRSGTTEAIVVLVAVDLLFAAFAAVQVVFLFGGTDTLVAIGMTYSDYARQGYFQLVGVVGLAGLLVIGAHHAVGRTPAFVMAALALLGLTGLILVSAAVRLALYQGAYGWTVLRFFVAASIGWLAVAVVAAIVLLIVARMRWLPHALAMSAVVVTLAVSAIGPQAFVIEENLARVLDPSRVAPGGHAGIDLVYGSSLGDDAIPVLVRALEVVPPTDAAILRSQLQARALELRYEAETAGPLSWNLARERALEALQARLPVTGDRSRAARRAARRPAQWQVPVPLSVKVWPATGTNSNDHEPADSVSLSTPKAVPLRTRLFAIGVPKP